MATQKLKDTLKGKKTPEVKIVNTITTTPVQRTTQDIGKWRAAMRAAEATIPRRTLLYDLYDDILIDGHLFSVWDKRERAITIIDWQFTDKDNKPVDSINALIDSIGFEKLLRSIMSSIAWGYGAGECLFTSNAFSFLDFPKKHIRPSTGIIAATQYSDEGVNIREGYYLNTCVEYGEPNDLGLLLKAAQYVIYKRGGFGDWSQFAELFGMPFRVGTYDGYDDGQRLKLEEALAKQGGAGWVVKPQGSNIEFIQNQTNSDGKLYDILVTACNKELSKVILGQTMTTEDGASRSQAQVHQDVENGIFVADVARVRRILNSKFIPILQAAGYDTKGGSFTVKNFGREKLSLKDLVEIILKLKSNGLPMDDDYLYETFGIPKPANYDQQKAANTTPPNAPTPTDTPPENTPATPPADKGASSPKPKSIVNNVDKNWLKRFGYYLKSFFKPAPTRAGLLEQLTQLYGNYDGHTNCVHCGGYIKLADGFNNDVENVLNSLLKDVYEGNLADGQIPLSYYETTAQTFQKAVAEGLQGTVFPADDYRNTLKAYLEQNVYAFSAAKSFAMLEQMRGMLTDENGDVVSFSKFKQKVSGITQLFNKTWLETEYNSAIACAQMAEKWESLKGFDYLEYRTVGDDRVRDTHKALDKLVLKTSDSLWGTIYPPNGWNCRCTVVPASSNTIATTESEAIAKMQSAQIGAYFKQNVGTDKIVFNNGHPYFKSMAKERELTATKNYAMKSVDKILLQPNLPKYNQLKDLDAAMDWWNKATNNTGLLEVKTADGLSVELNDWFIKHIINRTGKDRYKYAHQVLPLLQEPDEVWSHFYEGKKLQNIYIKYYDGAAYAVAVRISGKVEFKTFYEYSSSDKEFNMSAINNQRKGALKYKK